MNPFSLCWGDLVGLSDKLNIVGAVDVAWCIAFRIGWGIASSCDSSEENYPLLAHCNSGLREFMGT